MTTSPEAIALKAVDLISGMLAYWDRAERCVFANAAYAVWFGRDPAAMRGITMAEFLGPLYAVTLPFIERAFAGEPQQFERILTIPDGRVRHVLAEYTPDIVEGTVVGIIAHVTDVTTLREREAVLHRTTTLLDRVGAMAHVGGAEIDLRTGEVFWTAEMCRILDVDPAHVPPPARWDEFFEGDALTRYRAAVDEMRTRGVPLDLETPMITATGRRIWVRIVSTAVKDGDTVVKLISAHQDVTARKAADAALHASEAFAVDVLDSMDDYLAVIDERGAILSVNAAWRRFAPTCAWSPIDRGVVGADYLAVLDPAAPGGDASWREAAAGIRAVLRGERAEYHQECPCHAPSEPRWLLLRVTPLCGPRRGAVIAYRDVTAETLAITRLRDREARYRLSDEALRAVSQGVVITDPDHRIEWANDSFAAITGYTADEVVGRELELLQGPGSDPQAVEAIRQALAAGADYAGEVLHYRKSGEPFHDDLTISPVRDAHGRLSHFVSVVHDVTERQRAAAALVESDQRLRIALEATSDAYWDWDTVANQLYLSPRWYTMLGYPPEGHAQDLAWLRAHIHPDDQALVTETTRAAIESGTRFEVEARLKCANGTWRWTQSRGRVTTRDATGAAIRISGLNTDVHARKLAEDARAHLEAQLRQAQKMESVGRLAGGVAHDFNNMIGVILAYTEIALEQLDPTTPLHTDLVEVQNAAQRSAALTRQLLAFARRQVVTPTVLDPNAAVAHALTMLQRLIGENIHVAWQPTPTPWSIRIDPSQLDQVLTNLCVNARDAIKDVGTITIATANLVIDTAFCATCADATPGEFVRVTVTDDGEGMSPETLAHVFEPFFTTKAVGAGTGLGLATVYSAAQQNGGFITVETALGKGTSFHVHLPRHLGADAHAAATGPSPAARGTETVLLVEDEPAILHVLTRELERYGYRVLAASGPAEALRLAHAHREQIRLLLTDVIMPEMNGRDLANALKRDQPRLRALFMSGYPADVIATRGVIDPGVQLVPKPFTIANIVAKVRESLDRD